MSNKSTLSIQSKWFVVLALLVMHPPLLYTLFPVLGESSNVVLLIAPLVASWIFNWRVGVAATVINAIASSQVFASFTSMGPEEGRPKAVISIIVASLLCFGTDHLRRYVHQRRELAEELDRAKKMEAIGRLAGGVAHDMNNILNAIMGSVFAHRQELAGYNRPFGDLDNIAAACDRGAQLTRNLLGFARKSNYRKQVFSLNAVVEGVQAILARTADKHLQIDVTLSTGQTLVEGDRGQIENAIMNLCINGMDAMVDRGTLTITTEERNESIVVNVSDTGYGMDRSTRERVFEPFFTTKSEGKGTGLGLSMVYGVVHAMHGKIALDSAPDKGTSVTLTFPKADADTPDADISSEPPEPAEALGFLSGRTVLLVDDEPLVLRAGVRMIRTLGCEVLSARSGQEGVDLFKAHQGKISLAVIDLIMPDKDGIETLEDILQIDPNLPVILVSGYTRESAKMSALQGRRDTVRFLPKPFKPEALVKVAKTIMGSPKPDRAGKRAHTA